MNISNIVSCFWMQCSVRSLRIQTFGVRRWCRILLPSRCVNSWVPLRFPPWWEWLRRQSQAYSWAAQNASRCCKFLHLPSFFKSLFYCFYLWILTCLHPIPFSSQDTRWASTGYWPCNWPDSRVCSTGTAQPLNFRMKNVVKFHSTFCLIVALHGSFTIRVIFHL